VISLVATTIDERSKPVDLERIRRNHHEAIVELQRLPVLAVLKDIKLLDGVDTHIAHRQGHAVTAFYSAIRNAVSNGRIDEIRSGVDLSKFIVLRATGYGSTVFVDVLVL
jgi:hypothetical protein